MTMVACREPERPLLKSVTSREWPSMSPAAQYRGDEHRRATAHCQGAAA